MLIYCYDEWKYVIVRGKKLTRRPRVSWVNFSLLLLKLETKPSSSQKFLLTHLKYFITNAMWSISGSKLYLEFLGQLIIINCGWEGPLLPRRFAKNRQNWNQVFIKIIMWLHAHFQVNLNYHFTDSWRRDRERALFKIVLICSDMTTGSL